MTSLKLILKNVRKNIRDYLIYFLTLMLSVSLFYAFNSISDQPAFSEMGMTRTLLYDQLGIMLSVLSVLIAIVLAFLIIYANQFLLRRRKKELGIYMILGMKKGHISRIFAGETICVGLIALVTGLLFGFALSQGLSLIALKLFAIEISKFQVGVSFGAFKKTALCFAVIFLIVMLFNIWSVSSVQLIDLLTANRKNENQKNTKRAVSILLSLLSVTCIIFFSVLFSQNGILPTRGNMSFQIACMMLIVGTLLLFYSLSTVLVQVIKANKSVYLKGLNTFLVQQIGSKIRTNYFIMAVVCGLLTVTICAVSVGVSTALAMNELAQTSAPYDLNVLSNIEIDGDSNMVDYLSARDVNMAEYAAQMEQITLYEADMTYADLFTGQNVSWWPIDKDIPDTRISVVSLSDFNKALAMQGKEPVCLSSNQYLLNCNYKGTYKYVKAALKNHPTLTVAGVSLERASNDVLEETYFMTSVGNNDRGTLILPDVLVASLEKDVNVLLVLYKPETVSDEVLQKMIPIGLDDTHGYRYAEKNMMYDMFYGLNALVSFLCCYIGLIFLLICAALLALKQLTETTDNVYRYGLLQKLGAKKEQVNQSLFTQTAVFFMAPLAVASIFSVLLIQKAMEIVEDFMNLHISTNLLFTIVLFLVVYGSYFFATYLSCKQMVTERQSRRMEV